MNLETKLLHSFGRQDIKEYPFVLSELEPDEIRIRTIMTGVCRSDIGAYTGLEAPMSFGNFGHEGLGEVVEVGETYKDEEVKIGDIVSTFSDPAYADYYHAKRGEFVVVPEADSKYILQPVACGLNILFETISMAMRMGIKKTPILVLGSGFLTSIIAQASKTIVMPPITVVGKANKELFKSLGIQQIERVEDVQGNYKIIIDLSSKAENFHKAINILEDNGILCYAATPASPVSTNFFKACWKATTIILPSPRSAGFIVCMREAKTLIEAGKLDVSKLWTKEYDRVLDYKQAFEDGMNRPEGYVRGYLKWNYVK